MTNEKKVEEPIVFDDEYFCEQYELTGELVEDIIQDLWDDVFENHEMMLYTGSKGTWQGRMEMIPSLEYDTDPKSFFDNISVETLTVEIYSNKVEISNSHHDGTNSYTVIPFSFDMLKLEYVDKLIKEQDLRDDLNDYIINSTHFDDHVHKWYTCNKETKLEFLDSIEIEELPSLGNSDFLKKYKIEL